MDSDGMNVYERLVSTIENVNHTLELAARYGGEEFACILPEVDLDTALNCENSPLNNGFKIDHRSRQLLMS